MKSQPHRQPRFGRSACLASSLFAVLLHASPAMAQGKQPIAPITRYTGDILVKWHDGGNAAAAKTQDKVLTVASATGLPLSVKRPLSSNSTLVSIKGVAPETAPQIAAALARDPRIAAAEPDRWLLPSRLPNDPEFSSQLSHQPPVGATIGGANLATAWDRSTGTSSVVIAILDTGVLPHPDLQGRLLPGYDFITESARANDGDGRDGDATDAGDGATATECGTGSPGVGASGNSWHGTRVASVAGAATNNGSGIAGVDWAARILPVRVSGKCGARLSDVLDAMRWSAGLAVSNVPANPTPARVLNISLGGGDCSTFEQQAIDDVAAVGAVVVAAAGNTAGAPEAPGSCARVVSVTAHVDNGDSAHYASIGPQVTLSAPGGGCPTLQTSYTSGQPSCTTPSFIRTLSNSGNTPGSYTVVNSLGTSFAAPLTSGVVGLMLAIRPSLTPEQIIAGLRQSTRPHPANTYCTSAAGQGKCGSGLLDANGAVAYAQSLSAPPPSNGGGGGGGAIALWLSAVLFMLGACVLIATARTPTTSRR